MARKKKRKSSKKARRKGSKKRRKTGRKKRARRGGLMPLEVIRKHAKTLKRNKRAADVYRDVLRCS